MRHLHRISIELRGAVDVFDGRLLPLLLTVSVLSLACAGPGAPTEGVSDALPGLSAPVVVRRDASG